ncbi:MAG TPA: DUF2157 domain-containing protein [Caulobacteraceae bacterium]|nr:DUF2157 domain-containing protein [Caulobacteraceae bacterium]
MAYKDKVAEDLDRWIAEGLVSPDKRAAILASIPDARRLDAAAAMAWVGALLLGLAVIALVAANWSAIPRVARFAFVLGAYAAAAGGGAWAFRAGRPATANGLLTIAALVFAAAVGLSGQIFNLTGEPRTAAYAAGTAALALALAGGASGPAVVGLFFLGVADFLAEGAFHPWAGFEAPWLIVAAPAAALFAVRWRSAAMAHASAIALIAVGVWVAGKFSEAWLALYLIAAAFAGLGAWARQMRERSESHAGVFYGWAAWAATGFFVAAGYQGEGQGLAHRAAWLALSGGTIALGRHDRHGLVTAAGVVGLMGAVFAVLKDLGLALTTAAAVFFVAALVALAGGLALRRRAAR